MIYYTTLHYTTLYYTTLHYTIHKLISHDIIYPPQPPAAVLQHAEEGGDVLGIPVDLRGVEVVHDRAYYRC